MADVTGPTNTLPGSTQTLSEKTMCDEHPDREAVRRVQGETDSFGAEYYDLCQECLDEHREHQKQARIGECDWCRNDATDLRPRRDFEEGSCGRVYEVCGACVKAENDRLREEMADDDCW